MLFVVYGNDFSKKNLKKNEILDKLKKKRPDSVFLTIDEENFNESFLQQNINVVGLFEEKSIFEIKDSFLKKENEEIFLKNIDALNQFNNAFVFVEEKISEKTKKKLGDLKIRTYEFKVVVKKEEVNIFQITDLFLNKDKKNIWLKYQEFLEKGKSEEEIFSVLFWALKTLNITKNSKDIKETGLKPFIYSKNKKFLEKWKNNEVSEKMFDMIKIYHNSRRGIVDFKTSLEKLLLD